MTTDNELLRTGPGYDAPDDEPERLGAVALAWDWRQIGGRNFISPSQNQGTNCLSSAAFAVTSAMNARMRIELDIAFTPTVLPYQRSLQLLVPDLSAADLFYCGGGTCKEGLDVETALDYARTQGVVPDYWIPYTAGDQPCGRRPDDNLRVTKIYDYVSHRSVSTMKDAIQLRGPIIATFRMYTDFLAYRNSVYRWNGKSAFLNDHTLCVIGFTRDGWLCKNSFGPSWGVQGVCCIAYGECDIDQQMWEISGLDTIYPNGSVAGKPVTLTNKGVLHCIFRNASGRIDDLTTYPPVRDQPTVLDGLATGCNPCGIVNRNAQLHVGWTDLLGNLADNAWDNGWSKAQWLTGPDGLTAGPPAVGDPTVIPFNDELHYFYRDADGWLHHVWFDGKTWSWKQLTGDRPFITAPPAAGNPTVMIYYNTLHVCYRDINGNIQDIFGWPSTWAMQQLSGRGNTDAPPASGDPAVVGYNNQMHVFYRDNTGALQDVYFVTDWSWQTVPTYKYAAGDPVAINHNGGALHVLYRDHEGSICDPYYVAAGWGWQQLTGPVSITGGLAASGDPTAVVGGDASLHIHYCDINGNLSDVYWDGQGWRYVVRF